MTFLYNLFISLYYAGIYLASFFNEKAQKWIRGRKNIFEIIRKSDIRRNKSIWMHCASLGEFEQGRPLIEMIKNQFTSYKIAITFFSPSGYDIRKNYPLADLVCYLPLDTKCNAKKFIEAVNPSMALFVKYEFWFHHLDELKKRNIPVYLISASFRKEQHFFQWYGGWFRRILNFFTHIFVQDENSKNLLENTGIKNVTISGDTRFDRVYQTMQQAEEIPVIKNFKNGKLLFIAGSTWEEDERIISRLNFFQWDLKMIIAPHNVSEKNISRVVSLFPGNILRYSQLINMTEGMRTPELEKSNIMIIDNIGLLSRLYRYGDISYIGGAFGRSLHNILEAAAFGLPVLFGPDYHKNWEAVALIEKGGAFSINNSEELNDKISFLLHDKMILKIASEMSRSFVRSNTGATEKILGEIKNAVIVQSSP